MEAGKYYTHDKFTDVFFYVVATWKESGEKSLGMKVQWWNKGQMGTPFPIAGPNQTIIMTLDKANEFKELDT